MTLEQLLDKEYLGDGVYIGRDSFQMWLVTSDGIRTLAAIAIEFGSGDRIKAYETRIRERIR